MERPSWEEDEVAEDLWMGEIGDDEYDEDILEVEDEDDDYENIDDEDEAEEEPEEDELEEMVSQADTLIEEGEFQEALEILREAAERFPESPLAAYKVANTALLIFSDGIAITPKWKDDDDLVAFYEESINAFESALAVDGEYCDALNGLGLLYMVTDNAEGAIECWEKSLDIDPDQDEVASDLEEARAQLEDR